MKVIALEEHYWDRELAGHFKERGPEMRIPALQERLFDLGALRLKEMDEAGIDGTPAKVVWALLIIHAAYRALRSFLTWYRYHNDIWVITNQRLIDSYKKHPFSLEIATADLVNVQDMSVERNGVLRTMLDYGDILCQTAAEMQGFRLRGIPNPRAVQALVDRERDRERMRTR